MKKVVKQQIKPANRSFALYMSILFILAAIVSMVVFIKSTGISMEKFMTDDIGDLRMFRTVAFVAMVVSVYSSIIAMVSASKGFAVISFLGSATALGCGIQTFINFELKTVLESADFSKLNSEWLVVLAILAVLLATIFALIGMIRTHAAVIEDVEVEDDDEEEYDEEEVEDEEVDEDAEEDEEEEEEEVAAEKPAHRSFALFMSIVFAFAAVAAMYLYVKLTGIDMAKFWTDDAGNIRAFRLAAACCAGGSVLMSLIALCSSKKAFAVLSFLASAGAVGCFIKSYWVFEIRTILATTDFLTLSNEWFIVMTVVALVLSCICALIGMIRTHGVQAVEEADEDDDEDEDDEDDEEYDEDDEEEEDDEDDED